MSDLNTEQQNQHIFLSIVSHELKTPLTSIQGFTQAMQRKIDQKITTYEPNPLFTKSELEKHSEHLSIIMRQIKRLSRLMDDLLDTSVIETGALRFDWAQVNLIKLVNEVCERMQITSPLHQIVFAAPMDGDYMLTGDESRLEKVFSNILHNAIKYSPTGEKVLVDVSEESEFYLVAITDYGIGIPTEDHDKLFDLYYRGSRVDNKKFSGLGLGLYLSKQIIDKHRGTLTFTSTPGSGTTFFIRLPKQQK
jgi:signal transduction histidine kinase